MKKKGILLQNGKHKDGQIWFEIKEEDLFKENKFVGTQHIQLKDSILNLVSEKKINTKEYKILDSMVEDNTLEEKKVEKVRKKSGEIKEGKDGDKEKEEKDSSETKAEDVVMKDGEERNDCFKMEKVINSIITRINTYGKLAPSQQIGRRNKHKKNKKQQVSDDYYDLDDDFIDDSDNEEEIESQSEDSYEPAFSGYRMISGVAIPKRKNSDEKDPAEGEGDKAVGKVESLKKKEIDSTGSEEKKEKEGSDSGSKKRKHFEVEKSENEDLDMWIEKLQKSRENSESRNALTKNERRILTKIALILYKRNEFKNVTYSNIAKIFEISISQAEEKVNRFYFLNLKHEAKNEMSALKAKIKERLLREIKLKLNEIYRAESDIEREVKLEILHGIGNYFNEESLQCVDMMIAEAAILTHAIDKYNDIATKIHKKSKLKVEPDLNKEVFCHLKTIFSAICGEILNELKERIEDNGEAEFFKMRENMTSMMLFTLKITEETVLNNIAQ